MPAPKLPSYRRDLLLLALLFGLLFGFRLGSYPLANPDEGRNAAISREMVASGDWVTPRLNGVNYFEKPPLVYWAIAACQVALGANEWAVRTTPALFALAGVLLTYAAARRLHGRDAGFGAAAVLGTSLLYFGLSRIVILDMAVSVLMSATLFCFILGVREPPGSQRRWFFYGLYASAALATLTKGLIGFLLTGAVMFLWLLVFNQWRRLRPLHFPSGTLLFLVIATPWHVLAALRNETWAHRYFVYEHWERFTTDAASRPGPWWYFVPIVLFGIFPWTGFLWPAGREALRGGWAARRANADAWFFATWVAFVFLFFSISKSKLPPYILPVWPPLAVVIGAWLARAPANDAPPFRWGLRIFSGVCGFLAAALLVAVFKVGAVIRDPAQALALRGPAVGLAILLVVGGVVVPWLSRRHGPRAALAGMAAVMAVFFGGLTYAAPGIQKPGTKELALMVKTRARLDDRVAHYHEFFHDFTFYAGRVVDVVGFKGELELEEDAAARASGRFMTRQRFLELWAGPGRIFAVARKRDVRLDRPLAPGAPPPLFADPAFRYHLLAESPGHYLFSNQP